MQSFNTLLRRTAAALGAIAALTVTGIATSQAQQTVTLTGASSNTCTFAGAMTVKPDGSLEITCSSSTSPGTFSIVVPLNMATGATTTGSQARVSRSGGTSGAVDVALAKSGTSACTIDTPSPVSFNAGEGGSKNITISAGANPGTCVIGINPSAGTVSGTGTGTITVVDGDAPVEFAFQSSISGANVGPSGHTITATRSGGPNGAWEVPFTLAGPLSSNATTPLRGTLSATKFVFAANTSTASVTYVPPATTPASPTLPANLVLTLGQPTGPTPASAQTGSLGLVTTHTMTLNGPAVGCPVPETSLTTLGTNGFVNHTRQPTGTVVTYLLPNAQLGGANGVFGLYATSYTEPNSPVTEIHINKCKGLVQPTADGCYISSENIQKVEKVWMTATTPKYSTPAQFAAAGRCYAPPSQGPWYVNIRHTYSSCRVSGFCGWHAVWKDYSSY